MTSVGTTVTSASNDVLSLNESLHAEREKNTIRMERLKAKAAKTASKDLNVSIGDMDVNFLAEMLGIPASAFVTDSATKTSGNGSSRNLFATVMHNVAVTQDDDDDDDDDSIYIDDDDDDDNNEEEDNPSSDEEDVDKADALLTLTGETAAHESSIIDARSRSLADALGMKVNLSPDAPSIFLSPPSAIRGKVTGNLPTVDICSNE
jgi:hypothetical protein